MGSREVKLDMVDLRWNYGRHAWLKERPPILGFVGTDHVNNEKKVYERGSYGEHLVAHGDHCQNLSGLPHCTADRT